MSHKTLDRLADDALDLAISWYDATAPCEIIASTAKKIYKYALEHDGRLPGRIIPMTKEQLLQQEQKFISSFSE